MLKDYKLPKPIYGFTTYRHNGMSVGPYSHLNLSFTVGDLPPLVLKNRQLVSAFVHMPLQRWVWPAQAHTPYIRQVNEHDAGKGAFFDDDRIQNCDGLYTLENNLVLSFFHADCVPILFYDLTKHLIGAFHCGWQGAIIQAPLLSFKQVIEQQNLDVKNIFVQLGPSLAKENSDINQDLSTQIKKLHRKYRQYINTKQNGHYQMDTLGLVLAYLSDLGIPTENITISEENTYTSPDRYFSFQRDQITGRMATFIWQNWE